MASVKETVSDVMPLTNEAAMPLGLKRVINDTFKCQICHSVPIKPPVIATISVARTYWGVSHV